MHRMQAEHLYEKSINLEIYKDNLYFAFNDKTMLSTAAWIFGNTDDFTRCQTSQKQTDPTRFFVFSSVMIA